MFQNYTTGLNMHSGPSSLPIPFHPFRGQNGSISFQDGSQPWHRLLWALLHHRQNRATASIRDFDLSISKSKPFKLVQSHGDWTIAWNATFTAILCVFSHQAIELWIYLEYMLQFFGTLPHSQLKVINLNKAIWCYIEEVKHIELADMAWFHHLEACYLQDDGTGNQASWMGLGETLHLSSHKYTGPLSIVKIVKVFLALVLPDQVSESIIQFSRVKPLAGPGRADMKSEWLTPFKTEIFCSPKWLWFWFGDIRQLAPITSRCEALGKVPN